MVKVEVGMKVVAKTHPIKKVITVKTVGENNWFYAEEITQYCNGAIFREPTPAEIKAGKRID